MRDISFRAVRVVDGRASSLRRLLGAILLAVGGPALAGAETGVGELDRLLDTGAVMLALRVIEQEQPEYAARPVAWQRWERRRLAILESLGSWSSIRERIAGYPESLPDDFLVMSTETAARAHLALGDAVAAVAAVAELTWGGTMDTAMVDERAERLERWRALLVKGYLLGGRLGDAQTAALRFRLDYGQDPAGWRVAHAKALLRAGDDSRARELLASLESTEVEYLKLLLRARDPSVDPVELLSDMAPYLGAGRLLPPERAQLWAALADSAARYRDHDVRVTAMEQAIALDTTVAAEDRFVHADADALWDAYAGYAEALANEERLLVGRFDAWLTLADRLAARGGAAARALYAYLSVQNRDPEIAALARRGLVAGLAAQPRGLRILGALYLASDRFPEVAAVPEDLRAPLVAHCVAAGCGGAAGELLAGLDAEKRRDLAPPWRGSVAVALIRENRIDEALAIFADAFEGPGPVDRETVDAAVDAALALQTAAAYGESAALFERVIAVAAVGPEERRELLYLAAEAEGQAGHHERAARLYIASAAVPPGIPADAWSRSARLGAARALARAGLEADAAEILRGTLEDGPGAGERVIIERRLRRF